MKDEITTRPGEAFPPVGFLAGQPREELFDDVARQFEEMQQPLNMSWMVARNVSLEEVTTLSQKVALILRGYRALEPRDRIAFVSAGVFKRPALIDKPAETVLGQRQNASADPEQQNHDETQSHP